MYRIAIWQATGYGWTTETFSSRQRLVNWLAANGTARVSQIQVWANLRWVMLAHSQATIKAWLQQQQLTCA
jgi:hypothetical protein